MPFLFEKLFLYVFYEIISTKEISFSFKFLNNFVGGKHSPRLLKKSGNT